MGRWQRTQRLKHQFALPSSSLPSLLEHWRGNRKENGKDKDEKMSLFSVETEH